jgi:hypothetical protein
MDMLCVPVLINFIGLSPFIAKEEKQKESTDFRFRVVHLLSFTCMHATNRDGMHGL